MLKKHKILVEFIRKEETESWAIPIKESIDLINSIWRVAKKFKFDCYLKWYPKEKLNYKPTQKEYKIKTLEHIAKLSAEQFEFFIDDLRNFCNMQRQVKVIKKLTWAEVKQEKGMIWLDTWLNESKVSVSVESTNKI